MNTFTRTTRPVTDKYHDLVGETFDAVTVSRKFNRLFTRFSTFLFDFRTIARYAGCIASRKVSW
jgi:hypothetical protein